MGTPYGYVLLSPGGDLRAQAVELVRRGWTVHEGFALPDEPWWLGASRLVAVDPVSSETAGAAARDCAIRGLGLVVTLDPDAAWAATFRRDLDRAAVWAATFRRDLDRAAGPLPAAEAAGALPLSAEERDLLDLLAAGNSIARAARLRFLSLSTANRRVHDARKKLGVATNREAVVSYVRLRDERPAACPRCPRCPCADLDLQGE